MSFLTVSLAIPSIAAIAPLRGKPVDLLNVIARLGDRLTCRIFGCAACSRYEAVLARKLMPDSSRSSLADSFQCWLWAASSTKV